MEFLVIALVALFASLLTFFSGFGLGTLLLPALLLFFPAPVAIAGTGAVHLLNNLLKIFLIGKAINPKVLFSFGLSAMAGALAGSSLLVTLARDLEIVTFSLSGQQFTTNSLKLVIAALMLIFALFELLPALRKLQIGGGLLVPGGLLSGFFGGLSGHQGALRTAFLVKMGLNKEAFIATGAGISLFVDFARLPVYFAKMEKVEWLQHLPVLSVATLAAFAGAVAGRFLLKKITLEFVRVVVGVLIIALAVALALGLV